MKNMLFLIVLAISAISFSDVRASNVEAERQRIMQMSEYQQADTTVAELLATVVQHEGWSEMEIRVPIAGTQSNVWRQIKVDGGRKDGDVEFKWRFPLTSDSAEYVEVDIMISDDSCRQELQNCIRVALGIDS